MPANPSPAWERRNAAARAKGYRNYYDYRVHQYGKRPAAEPVQRGEEKRRAAGKRGRTALLRALSRPERIALVIEVPEASSAGQWEQMRYVITTKTGDIQEYIVRIDSADDLKWWRDEIDDSDVDFLAYDSGTYSGT